MAFKFEKDSIELRFFKIFTEFLCTRKKLKIDSEESAEYILKLNVEDEPTTAKSISYAYIAKDFFGNMRKKSYENLLSGSIIKDDLMIGFCNKFSEVLNSLSPNEKEQYSAINAAFNEWRKGIYKNNNWDIDWSISETDLPKSKTPVDEQSVYTSETEFSRAIKIVQDYYNKSSIPAESKNSHIVEQRLFQYLKKVVDARMEAEGLLGKFSAYKEYLRNIICTGCWDLYMLKGETVIQKRIELTEEKNEHRILKGYYRHATKEEDDKYDWWELDYLHGRLCLYEYPSRRDETDALQKPKEISVTNINFPSSKIILSGTHNGHYLHYNIKDEVFSVNTVAIYKIDDLKKKPVHYRYLEPVYYNEFEINNSLIPEHIRLILTNHSDLDIEPWAFVNLPLAFHELHDFYHKFGLDEFPMY